MKLRQMVCWILLALCLSGCAHNPESFYFGDYSEAEKLYNKGQYKEAIEKYESYLKEHPEGNLAVIAQYYIAKSHVELKETEAAKPLFEKILKEHPDVIWAKFSETQLQEMSKPKSSAAAS